MLDNVGQSKSILSQDDSLSLERESLEEWNKVKNSLAAIKGDCVFKGQSALLCADSRTALLKLPKDSVSCIITSPPYGDLKNYGSENQIGFGQNWEKEYLPDLEKVFTELYEISKYGAAMWVVLDMVKDNGEMIPLPWEVIIRSQKAGWTFHDLVIWDKGKSLPWSGSGKFRGVCEYILLLGKGKLAKFNLDAVRDSENLSSYWVKYPERYHPDGKAPSDLWHFPIPNQGSWSKKQLRHYCPFPIGLVARMIAISTNAGDIVLDPFAGTGSVPAISSYLDRYGVGIEINASFVNDFNTVGYKSIIEKSENELPNKNSTNNSLRETIINLRIQKYPKTLFSGLLRADQLSEKAHNFINAFFIRSVRLLHSNEEEKLDSGNLACIELQILLKEGANKELVDKAINNRINVAPLTIFGLKAAIETVPFELWSNEIFTSSLKNDCWYIYRNGKFYNYEKEASKTQLNEVFSSTINESKKMPNIVSSIKLSLESPLNV